MPGARQLLRASQSCRPGADDGNPLTGPPGRHDRLDPALTPTAIDDCAFDRLDRDRVVVDVQGAGRLARCGTDAAGKFRKIVGRVQNPECCLPLVAVDEIVPVRDQIVDRAALVTERDAAIHAARRLLTVLRLRQRLDELLPAAAADIRLIIASVLALDLEKSGGLTHPQPSTPAPFRTR